MSFVSQQQQTNRPGAAITVVGIHALLGAGLVFGLGGYVADILDERTLEVFDIDSPKPPPPPPEATPDEPKPPASSVIYTPPIAPIAPALGPAIGTPIEPVQTVEVTRYVAPVTSGLGTAIAPLTSVDIIAPIGAYPRNDNSRWVMQRDYRSRWRREGMAGTASFRVGVGTDGRVQSCSITRSSGHSQLDDATCKLVTKRARFNAARNSADEQVVGNYSGSVLWQLPQ